MRHSIEDLSFCWDIKKMFIDLDAVIIIEDDFNAIELENIIKQFDFIVASRYHSVIHAYKNNVPAIVLGWATKYKDLTRACAQESCFIDCNRRINDLKISFNFNKVEIDKKEDAIGKRYNSYL
jgi:polysaccharide pyruvyl transferase WcaK-like protein